MKSESRIRQGRAREAFNSSKELRLSRGPHRILRDTLEAQKQNITVAQLRAQRAMDEKRIAESLKTSPEFVKVQDGKMRNYEMLVSPLGCLKRDTNEINKLFPRFENQGCLLSWGNSFMMLRAQGISNLVAYNAVKGLAGTP